VAGVVGVKARLAGPRRGEAWVLFDPASAGVAELRRSAEAAGGERHDFKVIEVIESGGERR
jgi:hypothetical protein